MKICSVYEKPVFKMWYLWNFLFIKCPVDEMVPVYDEMVPVYDEMVPVYDEMVPVYDFYNNGMSI